MPLLPLAILLVVLVIPAIFAELVSPYSPVDGKLRDELLPPFWVNAEVSVLSVVEGSAGDTRTQVSVSDAERLIRIGDARALDGEEVTVGGRIEITRQRGGSTSHILGTDKTGRDILSRTIHGSRVTFKVAALSIVIGIFVGTTVGIVAGYFGGWVDALLMRMVDISMSLPIVLIALLLAATLGVGFRTVIIALVLLMWARFARLIRGETLALTTQDFIARARVAGASHVRIMFRHIFPNVVNSLIVLATLWAGWVILLEATLTFLGAGIARPTPAWGLMVADGRALMITAWWVSFVPGVAILLVTLSLNLLGDWLRDRLDPKQRQV